MGGSARISYVSEHLIRRSVDIDPNQEGALGILNLALAGAYQARRSYAPGTREADAWTILIDHLENLWKAARAAADSRFDPSGL